MNSSHGLFQGFNTVCLEADWPAAYGVNTAIKGDDVHPIVESFEGFKARFPEWMWRYAMLFFLFLCMTQVTHAVAF